MLVEKRENVGPLILLGHVFAFPSELASKPEFTTERYL